MNPIKRVMRQVLDKGVRQQNRTGVDTIKLRHAAHMHFDMNDGFPLETGRKMPWQGICGELVAFLRGAESAADFRSFGCNFWNQNANENQAWLANPNRQGHDDLGRIYGAQWRRYTGPLAFVDDENEPDRLILRLDHDGRTVGAFPQPIDQVMNCLNTIHKDPTNRRIIFSAWNPAELHQMALPPCHVLYQFTVDVTNKEISLCLYQRSGDLFLGVPCNVAECGMLLTLFGHLTGYKPRFIDVMCADPHIYVNHVDQVVELLNRLEPPLPTLKIAGLPAYTEGSTFKPHLIDIIEPKDFVLEGYDPLPAISAPMAV